MDYTRTNEFGQQGEPEASEPELEPVSQIEGVVSTEPEATMTDKMTKVKQTAAAATATTTSTNSPTAAGGTNSTAAVMSEID